MSASSGMELATLNSPSAAARSGSSHITVRVWDGVHVSSGGSSRGGDPTRIGSGGDESPSVSLSRATAAEHASECPVAVAPASHTGGSSSWCDAPSATRSAPASPSHVAAAAGATAMAPADHAVSTVRIWVEEEQDDESGPPMPMPPAPLLPLAPFPAPNLLALPSDCIFSILLLLDGPSLASLSSANSALLELSHGADAAFLWRGVARADVTRLPLHERMGFAEPNQWPSQTDEDDWTASLAIATSTSARSSPDRASALLLSPRAQYLLRLKQRALALQGRDLETRRQRSLVRGVRSRDALFVRRQVCLECAFMTLLPGGALAASALLQASDALESDHRWVVWIPLWACVLGALGMGVAMQGLSGEFVRRKRRERAEARGAPPNVLLPVPLPAPPSAAAAASSIAVPLQTPPVGNALPVGVGGAALAPGSNAATPGGGGVVAVGGPGVAAPVAAPRVRSDAALERERLNALFLSRNASGGSSGWPSSSSAHEATADGRAEGLLAALMGHYFSSTATARVNLARLALVLLFLVLLCCRTVLPSSRSTSLPYAACFAPLFLLGLHALTHPFLSHWFRCAPTHSSVSMAGSAGAAWFGRGGGLLRMRAVLLHLASFLAWWACPMLFLALLAAHLDDGDHPSLSLAQALAPLWAWQAALAAVLVLLVCRFGAGIVLVRRIGPHVPTSPRSIAGGGGSGRVAHDLSSSSSSSSCFASCLSRCPSPGLVLVRDPAHLNPRMGMTVACVLVALVGVAVFQALLCVRSAHSSDGDSDPLRSALVCLPLSLSLLLCLVLAAVSATQMRRQRLGVDGGLPPLADVPAFAVASSPSPSPPPSSPTAARGTRTPARARATGLAASPTVTSASATGGRRALSA